LPLTILDQVPLAPYTTLGLGGAARFFAEVKAPADMAEAVRWAADRGVACFVLGGGSNLVVGDGGFPGLVVHPIFSGQAWTETDAGAVVEAQAGEPWDDVVVESVRRGVLGIECLSGIPGSTGAAPVQNIGAYGQEVAEAIERVRVLDRRLLDVRDLAARDCGFGYRDSLFRREPDRVIILSVTLRLCRNRPAAIRYGELASALAEEQHPTPAQIRGAVLGLRRKKSMVFDPDDENRRSVGSFFTNPIVAAAAAEGIVARALAGGMAASAAEVPRFPLPEGRVKLAAGWLIERAGIGKGFRMGSVGISSRHALALVHHGGGSTADLLRLALHVRQAVRDRFGVVLVPEPVFLGVDWPHADS
jgi:UDP-N-acetylmuramate dehydrogenase